MTITTDILFMIAFVLGVTCGLVVMYIGQLARIESYQDRIEELNSIIFKQDKKEKK